MLASRSIRFVALRCRPAPLYTWSMKARVAPLAVNTTTTWYIRPPPMTAAYSKDSKNVFASSLTIQNRLDSTTAPQTEITTASMVKTSPTTSPLSKSTFLESTSSITPQTISSEPQANKSSSSDKSSDACNISPKASSPSNTVTDKCSKPSPDSPIQPPNIKLPSRDQVEKFVFTALVYAWDFCYYVFCLTLRLIDTYILKNPTLQEYWKKFSRRLDEQRQAIKSKK